MTRLRCPPFNWAKLLSITYAHLDTDDLNDPEVIMNIDISNAFNSLCRALKANEAFESACDSLRPMFDFFHGMRKGKTLKLLEIRLLTL